MKNCIIAQSGGPTVAINASLAGVMEANKRDKYFDNIYGSVNGILGILDGKVVNLTDIEKSTPGFVEKLKLTPAMYLGSCRFKLPEPSEEEGIYDRIFAYFEEKEIDTFFYIGGNDSMDTILRLSQHARRIRSSVKFIGIPKTIDNDLCGTDHTPGFGSAAKYIATSILEMAHDTMIYPVKSVTIIEIMGRDAGWLTASSVLARNEYSLAPHLIYLPERPFSIEGFLADVEAQLEQRNNVMVAVSEGIRDKDGNYISASEAAADGFGHSQLSGTGKVLEQIISDRLKIKARSVEVNILQRCAAHLSSLTDLDESAAQGAKAHALAQEGHSGIMVTIKRISDKPYTIEAGYAKIDKVANQVKSVPDKWISAAGNDVTKEMVEYLSPLIQGEPEVEYKDGLPQYLFRTYYRKA